jgi:hypothetical protein
VASLSCRGSQAGWARRKQCGGDGGPIPVSVPNVVTVSMVLPKSSAQCQRAAVSGPARSRLLFALIGAARRRRTDPNRAAVIHLIGFAVLIMLVLVAGAHDVSSWLGGK